MVFGIVRAAVITFKCDCPGQGELIFISFRSFSLCVCVGGPLFLGDLDRIGGVI